MKYFWNGMCIYVSVCDIDARDTDNVLMIRIWSLIPLCLIHCIGVENCYIICGFQFCCKYVGKLCTSFSAENKTCSDDLALLIFSASTLLVEGHVWPVKSFFDSPQTSSFVEPHPAGSNSVKQELNILLKKLIGWNKNTEIQIYPTLRLFFYSRLLTFRQQLLPSSEWLPPTRRPQGDCYHDYS